MFIARFIVDPSHSNPPLPNLHHHPWEQEFFFLTFPTRSTAQASWAALLWRKIDIFAHSLANVRRFSPLESLIHHSLSIQHFILFKYPSEPFHKHPLDPKDFFRSLSRVNGKGHFDIQTEADEHKSTQRMNWWVNKYEAWLPSFLSSLIVKTLSSVVLLA